MSKPKRKPAKGDKPLSLRMQRFVAEYIVCLNATKAATLAGFSAKTARSQGERLLHDPRVAAAIAKAQAATLRRAQLKADDVLAEFWAIATADARELIEYRRTCCRCCHSINHERQRTQLEMDRDRAAWLLTRKGGDTTEFNVAGGVGYDARRDPNPTCPECFGEGEPRAFIHDTRKLSPKAAALYAGVKITKDGIGVQMHDKVTALTQLGRHFGLFHDKVQVEDDLSEEELERRVTAMLLRAAQRKKAGVNPSKV